MKPELYMTELWTNSIILAIVMFLFVVILLISFGYAITWFRKATDETFKNLANQKSELIIDIKSKIVQKRVIDNKGREEVIENYPLDDFIYMLSINPETKTFRELLKLINNGESKSKINSKWQAIEESRMIFKLSYSDEKYSIVFGEIDLEQKVIDETIKLQLNESFVILKKKEISPKLFDEKIEFLDDNKLFQTLSKEVKSIKTKGWTIIRIFNKNSSLATEKDFWINVVQLLKIKWLLKNEGINSYFDLNGNLFFVQTSGRNSNHFSIMRSWNNRINGILDHKVKNNYLDIIMDDLVVVTVNDFSKDSRSINTAMIKSELLCRASHSDRNSRKYYDKVVEKSLVIHNKGSELVKLIADKKFPIKQSDFETKERNVKGITEYYIDVEVKILSAVILNSYLHKKDIIHALVKESNKRAGKNPTKINTAMLDISVAPLISKALTRAEMKENFYISFSESDSEEYSTSKYDPYFDELTLEGYKFIQLIRDIHEGSLPLLRDLKPEYILYTKDFSKVDDPEELVRINLAKINSIIDKNTKVVNIK